MSTSDILALLALLVSAASLIWTWYTHGEQTRLDREHKRLEAKVMQAQIQDRDDAAAALRRELLLRCSDLNALVRGIAARVPTPDGVRGVPLWSEEEVDRLRELASRVDSEAGRMAAKATRSLSQIASMVRPHLIKDSRTPAAPFEREKLTGAVGDARIALEQAIVRLE